MPVTYPLKDSYIIESRFLATLAEARDLFFFATEVTEDTERREKIFPLCALCVLCG